MLSSRPVWLLTNRTAYAAERNWVRDETGVHWWLVAIRATFEFPEGGPLSLAQEQVPPVLEPVYTGDPGASSLYADSDLLARKPTTDVILMGSAHAPKGKPASDVAVGMRVGAELKQLRVFGDRVYYEGAGGLTTTAPKPFVRQPLSYELAYGGLDDTGPDPAAHRLDERNPVGRGFCRRAAHVANEPAHVIEYPDGDFKTRGPAGFGPIDRGWLPRRPLAGTYDAAWVETKKPLLPDDYDARFALCSPEDQRPKVPLVGGERVGLLNVVPEGTVAFTLPQLRFEVVSRFGRSQRPHAPALLATVHIDTDARRVSLTWQSSLRVAAPDTDHLDETTVEEVTA